MTSSERVLLVYREAMAVVYALMPAPFGSTSWRRSHDCERGTQKCVRHKDSECVSYVGIMVSLMGEPAPRPSDAAAEPWLAATSR